MTKSAHGAVLLQAITDRKLKVAELSRLSGIRESAIHNMLSGKRLISPRSAVLIDKALPGTGIGTEAFLAMANAKLEQARKEVLK